MTTCRVCSDPATGVAQTGSPARGAAAVAQEGGPQEQSAVLLLRVWHEGDELRGRLLRPDDTFSSGVAVAQGIDAICDAVRLWLREV